MSGLRILPYTSLSLDVVNAEGGFEEVKDKLIFLNDCGTDSDRHLKKIARVLGESSIVERNRLISDLLSFSHLFISRVPSGAVAIGNLKDAIFALSKGAGEDIFSETQGMADYPRLFSQWLTAIDKEDSIIPFHLKPYTWDEAKWEGGHLGLAANFIFELLMSVRKVCG